MKCNTQKAVIKTGKVAPHELSRRSRLAQQRKRDQLAQASNLAGGERHYDQQDDQPKEVIKSIKIGGFDNGTLLVLQDAGVRLIDYDAAVSPYGLRMGKPTYLQPIKDEAERSTKEVDLREPETVRPKAPLLSEVKDSAGHRAARRTTGKATDPIYFSGRYTTPKPVGLFRGSESNESWEAAVAKAPFKMPRDTGENMPRGNTQPGLPMNRDGRLYADPAVQINQDLADRAMKEYVDNL
jgi:hypothetical protein